MSYIVPSKSLSKSKIRDVIRDLRCSEIPVILDNYWEFIPDDGD